MMLSFDEWNIWYQSNTRLTPWEFAPHILEDNYSLLDALAFGGLLCTLINNADRVRIACLAQMVNVIAPIFTEKGGKAIRQTIFYPFAMAAQNCIGDALAVMGKAPVIESAAYGPVSAITSAAAWNAEKREISFICLNISDEDQVIELDLRSFQKARLVEHSVLKGNDLSAVNTIANPDRVKPESRSCSPEILQTAEAALEPKSFHLFRFSL
jgi:alpha-N-arabinofuranosidase